MTAVIANRVGLIPHARAESADEKRKHEERDRHRPGQPENGPSHLPKGPPPPPPKAMVVPPQAPVHQPPPPGTFVPGKPAGVPPPPGPKKETLERFNPPTGQPGFPKGPPTNFQKGPIGNTPSGPVGPATTAGAQHGPLGLKGPQHFGDVQKGRVERIENGHKLIQEPGNRVIVTEGNRAIIRHDEGERFLMRPGAGSQRRPDGTTETFYLRPDGVRVVTVVDGNGRMLRRYRRGPDGVEVNIIDNRRFYRNVAVGVGVGVLGVVALNLAMPRITIPRDRYIVEYDRASDDDLYDTLDAPPLDVLDRPYSLDEIRYSYELRARMRRIDLDTITFDSGAWDVTPDQYYKLERVAHAILRVLNRNPDAVFMIEGHTDAVGSDIDNLSLSDRRASSVALVLSETFGVPPENLVTQGYGEQFLKINTPGPEPLNRRVTIINITPLMAER